MATGDKFGAVMQSDIGASGAGGVAGYDAMMAAMDGKAPAGYGYGTQHPVISIGGTSMTMAEFTNAIDTALSAISNDRSILIGCIAPMSETGSSRNGIASVYKFNKDYLCVELIASHWQYRWRIFKENGVWQPLEWINPPLALGTEYRTTERFNGKPVYARAVNCGAGPTASGRKSTYISISETVAVENVISVSGFVAGSYTIPPGNSYSSVGLYIAATPSTGNSPKYQITVVTMSNQDVSSSTIYAIVKYTKTSDTGG